MILSLTRQVFFLIPLILILPLFMGIDGVMFAGPIADTMAFITTVILISMEMRIISRQQAQSSSAAG